MGDPLLTRTMTAFRWRENGAAVVAHGYHDRVAVLFGKSAARLTYLHCKPSLWGFLPLFTNFHILPYLPVFTRHPDFLICSLLEHMFDYQYLPYPSIIFHLTESNAGPLRVTMTRVNCQVADNFSNVNYRRIPLYTIMYSPIVGLPTKAASYQLITASYQHTLHCKISLWVVKSHSLFTTECQVSDILIDVDA